MRLLSICLLLAACTSPTPPETTPGDATASTDKSAGTDVPPPPEATPGSPAAGGASKPGPNDGSDPNVPPVGPAGAGTGQGGPGTPPTPGMPPGGGGEAGSPPGGGQLPTLSINPGQGVVVSGTLKYAGAKTGAVRIDVVKPKEKGGDVVHAVRLDKLGAFSFELPKDTGKVVLNAFVDANGDGPSAGEPVGHSAELLIGSAPMSGVTITLDDSGSSGKGGDGTVTNGMGMGPADAGGSGTPGAANPATAPGAGGGATGGGAAGGATAGGGKGGK